MKNRILLFCFILAYIPSSCKKATVNADGDVELPGKWKVISRYISAGPPGEWYSEPANSNNYVEFKADGSLTGNVFADYSTYAVKDSVTLTMKKKDSNVIQNYSYNISTDTLTLSPSGPIICIEGCAIRFVKQ